MKLKDIYELKEKRISKDLDDLNGVYYSHIRELRDKYSSLDFNDKNEKIIIKHIAEHAFDFRRGWRLSTVWFEDKPVMVVTNAGREYDNYCKRYITDVNTYGNMLNYIENVVLIKREEKNRQHNVYNENADVEEATHFYDNDLSDFYPVDVLKINPLFDKLRILDMHEEQRWTIDSSNDFYAEHFVVFKENGHLVSYYNKGLDDKVVDNQYIVVALSDIDNSLDICEYRDELQRLYEIEMDVNYTGKEILKVVDTDIKPSQINLEKLLKEN